MREILPLALVVGSLACAKTSFAHLGEVHPQGQHQYFPDIERTEIPFAVVPVNHTTGSWWTDAHHVPGDDQTLILGSRFQSLHAVTEDGKNLYLTTGEDYRWSVEGMSAFEFHPDFGRPQSAGFGKFYTITTELESAARPDFVSGDGHTLHNVLREWTVTDPSVDVFSGTSRELMRFQESNKFHNVNDLEFDHAGMLLISLGEDGDELASARLDSVFGKILRIDPVDTGTSDSPKNYGIPADNPFVDDPNARPEVYAYGLRNPWRITYDHQSNELWAFDAGWQSIEEVNRIVPGGNYGWPTKEGSLLAAREAIPDTPDPVTGLTQAQTLGLIEPVFEYDHLQGVSVVGGVVYRGDAFPWLQGKVVFADVGVGSVSTPAPRVFYGDPDTGEIVELLGHEAVDSIWGLTCTAQDTKVSCPIYSINEAADGELLILGKSILRLVSLPADFNADGKLDAVDIERLSDAVRRQSRDLGFDTDQDGDVDGDDRTYWIEVRKRSYFGDSNLDGLFDSSDLIEIFQAGEYEDEIAENSSWATGDWSGDREFDASDLVLAFQRGGYGRGPRVLAVPEPYGASLFMIGTVTFLGVTRQRRLRVPCGA